MKRRLNEKTPTVKLYFVTKCLLAFARKFWFYNIVHV
jgi:hypothetical protein